MRKIDSLFVIVAIFITTCSSAKTISVHTVTPLSQTTFRPTTMPAPTLTPTRVPIGVTEIANLGKGSAKFVDWSPDGKLYAIGGSFGVRIFDAKTHSEIKLLPYPAGVDIRFSPDSRLISVIDLFDITIIRISDGRVLSKIDGRGDYLFSVTFSPDSQSFAYILSCYIDCKDYVYIQTVGKSNEAKEAFQVDVPVYPGLSFYQVAFDSSGTVLYGAASDNTIHVWDVATGKLKYTLKGHTNEVLGFIFSPDAKLLASYGKDFRVIVWNLKTKQPYRTIVGYKGTIKKLTFSSEGSRLNIIFDDNSTLIRDLATGETSNTEKYIDSDARLLQQLRSTGGYIDYINGLAFSPDGQTLAVSSSSSAPILLWDIPSHKVRATLDTKAGQLLYSHHGDFLASFEDDYYGENETVSIWDTHSNRKLWTQKAPSVSSIAFSPDDSTLAVGTKGIIDLWDIQQGVLAKTIVTKGEWVEFLSYSPDGNTLSSAATKYVQETYTSDFLVQSWNVATGNLVHEYIPLNNNLGPLGAIIGFSNGVLAIFRYRESLQKNTAELWDVNTGQRIQILTGIDDFATSAILAFNPKAQVVALSYTYGITFYNSTTGKIIYVDDKEAHYGNTFSFSPDGNFLALGDAEGNIILFDVSQIVQASSDINP